MDLQFRLIAMRMDGEMEIERNTMCIECHVNVSIFFIEYILGVHLSSKIFQINLSKKKCLHFFFLENEIFFEIFFCGFFKMGNERKKNSIT